MSRILAIDDSTTNNALLEAVLNAKGYEVIIAETPALAMNVLAEQPVDLILLDLLFPEINGFDFLAQIKKDNRYANIPVIVVSAACEQANILKVKELGAIGFIPKPINLSYFIEQIENALIK